MIGDGVRTSNRAAGASVPWAFECYENTGEPTNGAYSPLNDAHGFGKVVVDMYREWYEMDPLDIDVDLVVHFGGFEASWNGARASFGDGNRDWYPMVSLDVVSHEIAHGFTERQAGLLYFGQSGGMNEAFSDMAGEAAEYYLKERRGLELARMPDFNTAADLRKAQGEALRYMCSPSRDGRSIDHVGEYVGGMGVHYSSGIYNRVFCLLSNATDWDVKRAFDVFVLANLAFWTPNETFERGARGVLRAARQLGYAEADVVEAFREVGIELR